MERGSWSNRLVERSGAAKRSAGARLRITWGTAARYNEYSANERGLAGGFGGLFLLGLFFLFFFLVLVADDFEDGHFGVVADAIASSDDARVAAGAIAELRCDLAEELLRDGRHQEISSRLSARL